MADKPKTANANESDISNDSDPSEPKYVTAAQLNAAITARFKGFESKLDDYLSKLQPQTPAPSKKDEPSDEMAKRIAALEKQNEAFRKEAETAKAKHLDTTLRTRLGEELSKHGIAQTKHALALLVDGERRVAWGADEQLVWKGDDGTESPLGEGLKAWAKSADARIYMAPTGAKGSGDRGAAPINGTNPKVPITRRDVGAALLAHMRGDGVFGSEE